MSETIGGVTLNSFVMRLRRITLVAVLILVGVLVAAFLIPTSHRGPEVRLVRVVRKSIEPPDPAGYTADWLTMDILKTEQEVWTASFEILSPVESGLVLSLGHIKVEVAGPDGNWTATVLPPGLQLPLPVLGDRINKARMNFTVPCETRSCRFTIGYRSLTLQERCSLVLAKWDLWRRFPKLSAWISGRLPNEKERWMESRRELVLPRVPLEQETHNPPLQATAP